MYCAGVFDIVGVLRFLEDSTLLRPYSALSRSLLRFHPVLAGVFACSSWLRPLWRAGAGPSHSSRPLLHGDPDTDASRSLQELAGAVRGADSGIGADPAGEPPPLFSLSGMLASGPVFSSSSLPSKLSVISIISWTGSTSTVTLHSVSVCVVSPKQAVSYPASSLTVSDVGIAPALPPTIGKLDGGD